MREHLVSHIEDFACKTRQVKQADLIQLDFSNAFEKVIHSKLIMKLCAYGTRNTTLRWTKPFLVAVDRRSLLRVRSQTRSRPHL